MSENIYLRPLQVADASISYHWRNNPKIWRFTGSKPDQVITEEIEKEWIQKVLQRKDELRMAICLKETDEYIGNVFLTGITDEDAEIHIFIGEVKHWGGNNAYEAVHSMITLGFDQLKLKRVNAFVNPKNTAAGALAENNGFVKVGQAQHEPSGLTLDKYVITPR